MSYNLVWSLPHSRSMFVRALVPLALSSTLLLFGPSARGDLELDVPAVETAAPPAAVAPRTAADDTPPLDPVTESLLASRLSTLDAEIPGLVAR